MMNYLAHRFTLASALLACVHLAFGQTAPTPTTGSAIKGKEIYEARCSACHSVDINRVGPMHIGVFGRKVGSVKNYQYSEALTKSKVIWDRESLTAWLSNPEDLIPGQRMGYSLENAQDRENVVAYLATLITKK